MVGLLKYSDPSHQETTLAIHAIAEAQKAGGIAAFIDAEHAFDRFMPNNWVWMLKICLFLNPIVANRHWRLPSNSFALRQ